MFEVHLKPLQISYPNHRFYGVLATCFLPHCNSFPLSLIFFFFFKRVSQTAWAGHAVWSHNPEMDISIYFSLSLDDSELRYPLLWIPYRFHPFWSVFHLELHRKENVLLLTSYLTIIYKMKPNTIALAMG